MPTCNVSCRAIHSAGLSAPLFSELLRSARNPVQGSSSASVTSDAAPALCCDLLPFTCGCLLGSLRGSGIPAGATLSSRADVLLTWRLSGPTCPGSPSVRLSGMSCWPLGKSRDVGGPSAPLCHSMLLPAGSAGGPGADWGASLGLDSVRIHSTPGSSPSVTPAHCKICQPEDLRVHTTWCLICCRSRD